jgi:MFS family permease
MLMDEKAAAREDYAELAAQGAGWIELFKPRYLIATATLTLGTCLFAFNSFFVSTSMPSAVAEFGQPWLLPWAFTLYLVFAIVGGAFAANLKQRLGGRFTLIAATLVFAVGTLLACVATHSTHILAGRLLQGAGEGVTIAICYALIPELYPSRLVPKVFGMEAVAWAVAAFTGPLLAGVLTEYLSWRAAFASGLPPAVLFILLTLALSSSKVSTAGDSPVPWLRLSMVGAGILLISVSGMMVNIASIMVLLALAVILLLSVVRIDAASPHRILPANAFSVTRLPGAGLWIILLMPVAGSAGAVYMVYGLQVIWGLGPAEAGISNAVLAMSWSLTAIGVASLKSQALRIKLIGAGTVLLVTGLALVIIAVAADQFWIIYPGQFVIGSGFGACWGTLSQLLIDKAPAAERDKTSVLLPTLQSAGYAIGGAIFGLVANLAGLREGIPGDAIRVILLPVFLTAVVIAAVSIVFSYRTLQLSVKPK